MRPVVEHGVVAVQVRELLVAADVEEVVAELQAALLRMVRGREDGVDLWPEVQGLRAVEHGVPPAPDEIKAHSLGLAAVPHVPDLRLRRPPELLGHVGRQPRHNGRRSGLPLLLALAGVLEVTRRAQGLEVAGVVAPAVAHGVDVVDLELATVQSPAVRASPFVGLRDREPVGGRLPLGGQVGADDVQEHDSPRLAVVGHVDVHRLAYLLAESVELGGVRRLVEDLEAFRLVDAVREARQLDRRAVASECAHAVELQLGPQRLQVDRVEHHGVLPQPLGELCDAERRVELVDGLKVDEVRCIVRCRRRFVGGDLGIGVAPP